ncbi:LOW QUALITY PROTEIN: hypothetical protein Cgig2_023227 [Carnegiea gigantea]|uniref:Uncharacterized protein n=1 Tax=Carnegiea gigantea TaxID=171969 RepID=A0A9Q1GMK6_9CARY|nr:LOW QUALITY PROTEIN: hypothetical protein Cgig2_023227 [Carnegiea gigantea]
MPPNWARRLTMDVVMWATLKLDWGPVEAWIRDDDQRLRRAQAARPADSPTNPVLAGGPSKGRMSFFPSFHDTAVEYVRDNLHWTKREMLSLRLNLLPWNFSAYYPEFNHIMAMGEDSVEGVITADFNHLEREMISRERSSAPLSHTAFKFTVSISSFSFVSLKVHPRAPSKHCLLFLYIMSSSCSSSRDVPEGLANPQVKG